MKSQYSLLTAVIIAIVGVVVFSITHTASAATAVQPFNGGTGLTISPSYGQLLVGNSTSGYMLMSTSSLGITASGVAWGAITGTLASQTDLQNALNAKLGLSSWYATTTNGLAEGGNNLYFTNARAVAALTGQNVSLLTNDAGYVTSSFSTTSAAYWQGTTNFFSTTSDAYFLSQNQGNAFSTTSAAYWLTQQSVGGFSTTSANYWLTLNQGNAFSTTSSAYFLGQNQNLAFSTTSVGYWKTVTDLFSTTSANAWGATKGYLTSAVTGVATTSLAATYPIKATVSSASINFSLLDMATTTATCTGTVSCSSFTVLGSSPITITGSAGSAASSTLLGDNNTFSGLSRFGNGTGPSGNNDKLYVTSDSSGSTNAGLEVRQNGGNANGLYVHSGDNIQGVTLAQISDQNTTDTGTTLALLNKGSGNLLTLGNNANNAIDVVTNSGNIGIATSSLTANFEIDGSNAGSYTTFDMWNHQTHGGINTDNVGYWNGVGPGLFAIGSKSNNPLVFLMNGQPACGIDSDNALDTIFDCAPPAGGSEATYTNTVPVTGGTIWTDYTTMIYPGTYESSINVAKSGSTVAFPTYEMKFWDESTFGPQSNATSSNDFFVASSSIGAVAVGWPTVQSGESSNQRGGDYGLQASGGIFQVMASSTDNTIMTVYSGSTTVSANQVFQIFKSGASTTNLTASGSICLGGVCNSSWPAGGAGAWPFTTGLTNFATAVQSTTTPEWFQGSGNTLMASGTAQFVNASSTNLSASGSVWANGVVITSASGALNFSGGGTSVIQQNGFTYASFGSSQFGFFTGTYESGTGGLITMAAKMNASSGQQSVLLDNPGIYQTGSAGYSALVVQPTESTLGNGPNFLIQAGTSTNASLFTVDNGGRASTTMLTVSGSLCLGGVCNTSWPAGGSLSYTAWGGSVATTFSTSTVASTTPAWFQMGLYASSTSQFANASSTNLSVSGTAYLTTASTTNLTAQTFTNNGAATVTGTATFGTILANGNGTITNNPPNAAANVGWKTSLYTTQFAMGVANSTFAFKATGGWMSLFGVNPANNGSIVYPDSSASVSFSTDGAIFATSTITIGTTTKSTAAIFAMQPFGSTKDLLNIASTTSAAFASSSVFIVKSTGNVGIATSTPNATLTDWGSISFNVNEQAGNYTVATSSDYKVGITSTASARTVTLPLCNSTTTAPTTGIQYMIKDQSNAAGTNNITVQGANGQKIDGASTYVINTNAGKVHVYCDPASTVSPWWTE